MATRKRTPKKKAVVAPFNGQEVTAVCEWEHIDERVEPIPGETDALNNERWLPRTVDFEAVANTPNTRLVSGEQIEVKRIRNMATLFELFTKAGGGTERPPKSIHRFNIIGHGQQRLLGLTGHVDLATGRLGLNAPPPPPDNDPPQTENEQRLADTRFDNATILSRIRLEQRSPVATAPS